MTLWHSADATDAWRPSPSGRPGGQKRFSDVAIETALVLRLALLHGATRQGWSKGSDDAVMS